MLEWVVISLSRGSSRTKNWTWVSCISCFDRQILYLGGIWATWEAPHLNTTAQTLNGFPFHWEEKSDPSQWITGPWHCCPAPLLSRHPANPATWPPCSSSAWNVLLQVPVRLTSPWPFVFATGTLSGAPSQPLCLPGTPAFPDLPPHPSSLVFSSTALTTVEQCTHSLDIPGSSATHMETQEDAVLSGHCARALPGTQWGWVKMLQESSEELPDSVRNMFPMAWGSETVPLNQHSFILCSLSLPSLRGGEVSSSPSGRAPWESWLLLQRRSHLQAVPISWKQWKQWQTLFSWAPKSLLVATHSSVLAWRIPWTEEPGGLQSMGSLGVGHDWRDLAAAKSLQMVTAAMKLRDACFLEEKLW